LPSITELIVCTSPPYGVPNHRQQPLRSSGWGCCGGARSGRAGRSGDLWARIEAAGREDADTTYHSGDGLPASDSPVTIRWWEHEAINGVAIAHIMVVPFAVKPHAAQVAVTVFARKFSHGLFPLATVADVVLDEDGAAWAAAVKQRLGAELATAKVPGGGLLDESFLSGAITTFLS
jgi:hypothetical protein